MKLNDVSREWRILLGLALVILGVGNWLVGRHKTREYNQIIAAQHYSAADQAYRSFDELDDGGNAVLEPFTDEQRRVSYATARMDFYHVTFLTGDVMVVAGLFFTFFGFIGLIRRDATRAALRLDLRSLGQGPPAV